MRKNKREELSRRRPLDDSRAARLLWELIHAAPALREGIIFNELTYDQARQLAHDAGIRRIKGNCRKVLLRRLNRLTTVDRTGRLDEILGGR